MNPAGPTTIPILTSISATNITLNYNAIKLILDKVGDNPLCIISINGKFRKGKSLMLNFFLQYLRARIAQNTQTPENWFQPSEVGRDFNWRGGHQAETNGISIYSEPFEIKINEQSVAILLLDTQGSFDDQTSFQDNAVIFALSSLLSSVMVMNIEHDVTDDMLQFLQFFAGYAQLALQDEDTGQRTNASLFAQSLLFLVRDFQWIDQFSLGMHDDNTPHPNYKKVKLDVSQEKATEANFVRDQIREMFPKVAVNLLPHPGNALACRSVLDRLDVDFEEEVIRFVENTFAPQNIVKKTISGEIMTGNKLQPFVQRWQTVFENDTPTVKNLTQATAEVQNMMALTNAEKHFDLKMKEFFTESADGVPLEAFYAKTESLKLECFAVFKQAKKFGGKAYEDKFSEDLNNLLDTKTEYYKQLNSERVQGAEKRRALEQQKDQLAQQYNDTLNEFEILKVQSGAEIQRVTGELNKITKEMNESLEDNKELKMQHQLLGFQLQSMQDNSAKDQKHYEERMRLITSNMEQQNQQYQNQINDLNRRVAEGGSDDSFCIIM